MTHARIVPFWAWIKLTAIPDTHRLKRAKLPRCRVYDVINDHPTCDLGLSTLLLPPSPQWVIYLGASEELLDGYFLSSTLKKGRVQTGEPLGRRRHSQTWSFQSSAYSFSPSGHQQVRNQIIPPFQFKESCLNISVLYPTSVPRMKPWLHFTWPQYNSSKRAT